MARAQRFSSEYWHDGSVQLADGTRLNGRIKYNMEAQSVLFTSKGETIQTLSPRKLESFEIYDEIVGMRREFYILPYKLNGNYATPVMFEVPFQGEKISLLRTEKIETVVRTSPYMYGGSYSTTDVVYTYYFLKPGGNILEFNGKRSDLMTILGDKSAAVRKYMKENNFHLNSLADLVRICAYYNSL